MCVLLTSSIAVSAVIEYDMITKSDQDGQMTFSFPHLNYCERNLYTDFSQ